MNKSGPSLASVLRLATNRLESAGTDTARLDARILLQEAGGYGRTHMIVASDEAVPQTVILAYEQMIDRRLAGEPVHRILGWREFFGRRFCLGPETLVPRPDTEILVEAALAEAVSNGKSSRILDIGTGSGVVAITLAAELPGAVVWATDISPAALRVVDKNADLHDVAARIILRQGDLFDAVEGERFDMIVSNPPYIPHHEIARLQPEVRNHDPVAALDGGDDGLEFYRRIFAAAPAHLHLRGKVLLEIGHDQAEPVLGLAASYGFEDLEIRQDLGGRDRVVSAALRG